MYFTKFGPCDEYQKDAYFKRRTETTTSRRRPGHMYRSKGSLALILPTAWAPSHKAADGHTFRSAHVSGAPCTTDMQGVVAGITDTLAPNHKNVR